MAENTGLTIDFKLSEGKFVMKTGVDKVDADMSMLQHFFGWFRVFSQDYCVNSYWLWLRTNTFVTRYQDILKLDISRVISKYVPFAQINKVDIGKKQANAKELKLDIIYSYNLAETKAIGLTEFIKTVE